MNPKLNFTVAGIRRVIILFLPAIIVAGFPVAVGFSVTRWSQQENTITLQDVSGTHSLVTNGGLATEQGGILIYHKLRDDESLLLSWHMLDESSRQKVIDGHFDQSGGSTGDSKSGKSGKKGTGKSGGKDAKETADSKVETLPISGLENVFAPLSKTVDKESALLSEGLVTVHCHGEFNESINQGIVFAVQDGRAYVFGACDAVRLQFVFGENGKPKSSEYEMEIQWYSPERKKVSARWEYFDNETNTFVASAPARNMPGILKVAEADLELNDKVRIIGYEIMRLDEGTSKKPDHALARFDSFGTVTRIIKKENSRQFGVGLDNKSWGRIDRSLIFDSAGNAIGIVPSNFGHPQDSVDMLPIGFPPIPD